MKTKRCDVPLRILAVWLALVSMANAQFTFTTNNDTITLTGYAGSVGLITLPSSTNGYPVVNIADDAFYNNDTLTNVTIPGSITNIGYDAFETCDSLESVTISNGMVSIEDGAFLDSSLTNITLPATVTNLGNVPFYGCDSLTAINVAGGNPAFTSVGGVLFDAAVATLVEYPPGVHGDYTVPDGVVTIGTGAFETCGLYEVTLASTVTNIEDQAFEAAELFNITIPAGVTNIGQDVFSYCYDLTNIAVSAGNPDYSSLGGVLFNKSQTTLIRYPTGLGAEGSYTVPAGVTEIGIDAFEPNEGLTNITLPASLADIEEGAFFQCYGIQSLAIPAGVTNIGESAFDQCSSLTNLTIPGSGATSIGDYAFGDCLALTSVTIGGGVTNLGSVFNGSTNLATAYFQGDAPGAGDYVFYGGNPIVYYLPGTYGWGPTFGGATTEPWTLPYPIIIRNGVSNGVFGLTVSWATNLSVVVQAGTNLDQIVWGPIKTNSLSPNGWFSFSDSQWTNYRSRFYRISGP